MKLSFFDSTTIEVYDEDWESKQVINPRDFSLQNNNITVAFSQNGLLKAITIKKPSGNVTIPINLDFLQ